MMPSSLRQMLGSSAIVIFVVLVAVGVDAFHPRRLNSRSYVFMSSSNIKYPLKISNVLTKMTASTQIALQQRTSRMEIELPPGADFGVEASSKQGSAAKMRKGGESNSDKIKRSNREAARLVAEMFSVLSSNMVALFPSESEANDARIKWGPTFRGEVYSIDTPEQTKGANLYSRRVSKQEQEQALLGSDGVYIPDGTEVVVAAGPRLKDIKKLRKVHEKLGDDTLIILINARASVEAAAAKAAEDGVAGEADWVSEAFSPVFHYAPPLLADVSAKNSKPSTVITNIVGDKDLLLYHEFGGQWYLAEKERAEEKKGGLLGNLGAALTGGAGAFKTLLESPGRPSRDQMIEAIKTGGASAKPEADAAAASA